MVNGLVRKRSAVVKLDPRGPERAVTAHGGLASAEALANRLGLWTQCRRALPARRDPSQGFETTSVVAALVHALLADGKGFCATEPMRGDAPLLDIVGLERAPSAETVEQVTKFLAEHGRGHAALGEITESLAAKVLSASARPDLLEEGFLFVWGDGTLLETCGKTKEAIKVIGNARGQLAAALFAGPCLVASDFAREGTGEQCLVRQMVTGPAARVLKTTRLLSSALIVLDSLHGDGPTLELLESPALAGSHFIVGAQKLAEAQRVLASQPECAWVDTGPRPDLKWEASAVCTCWIQCADWPKKRLLVGRRFRRQGEMIWTYAGVITDLERGEPRVAKLIERLKVPFAEVIWRLYTRKQAMENAWKDLLIDLGLHHPPSGSVAANAVFLAIAGLAYNLSVGVRRLLLTGPARTMRLWRLRREVFELPARVMRHARQVTVRLLDARAHLREQLQAAMLALARL
jgi:hypothetical protein